MVWTTLSFALDNQGEDQQAAMKSGEMQPSSEKDKKRPQDGEQWLKSQWGRRDFELGCHVWKPCGEGVQFVVSATDRYTGEDGGQTAAAGDK